MTDPNASALPAPAHDTLDSVDAVQAMLAAHGYLADRRLATALFLSLRLQRPLFLEGEAGVGKTELAKILAAATGAPLIRLQCHEGLDISQAAYEWNVSRQLLHVRLAESGGAATRDQVERSLYARDMLLARPLLAALETDRPAVLLIDELDRADEPFEAFLLEVLSDWQITIPELGTVRARHRPRVIVTSNRTREIHDALKRRCLYHWVEFPDLEREYAIVARAVPAAPASLTRQAVAFVQRLRGLDLFKSPGIAETIDWVDALVALDRLDLDPAAVSDTLGVLLKYQDDLARMEGGEAARLLQELAAVAGKA
jgi:MoxR-like ATPase